MGWRLFQQKSLVFTGIGNSSKSNAFQLEIRHPGGSAKDGQSLRRAPMTDIYVHEGIEPELRLKSYPPLLRPPEEPGTRYLPSNIRERDAYGGGSVCVWGGISLGGRTDLHVFPRGTVNAQTYRDDILDAYVRPYAGAIVDDFLLQDDNARPRRARILDDYLQQQTIQRMEWPPLSPDLNPFDHVWDALERRIAALNPPLQTPFPLATALQEQRLSLPHN
ncbi:hypothetical protein AVEN_166223-1 [Araneus ventricosus]|uniref:Tc1-like transposase DDE domain-containing protein n=1 Tax=Araneus ventricosus TaxID=182803 RepID=A0A4Y2FTQ4_ARAVE|nr:hypothetical protein AVEN_166223-1 [Araneus ventricosus]